MFQPILKLNTTGLKILTPNGFENFAGVSYNGEQETTTIRFADNSTLETTLSHLLFRRKKEVAASSVKPGMILDGTGTTIQRTVVGVRLNSKPTRVFDVVHSDSHTYIVNGKVSHNCIFVSSDPLLIDSMKAQALKALPPITNAHGIKIWEHFDPDDTTSEIEPETQQPMQTNFDNWYRGQQEQKSIEKTYHKQCIVTVDPGKGVGGDYTVVQVFSYPALEQMMELRTNESKTGEIYKLLRYIWRKAEKAGWSVMFTVENNGVGEGIVTLFENDEKLPENVEMVNDDGRQVGMNTNANTKFQACKIFKEFIESGRLKVRSADLIREIKTFVKVGASYAAQNGSTDDCVSATLLVCRVVKQISSYDDDAYQTLYEVGELEDDDGYGGDGDDYDVMPMSF
jgi:hypothetical protein